MTIWDCAFKKKNTLNKRNRFFIILQKYKIKLDVQYVIERIQKIKRNLLLINFKQTAQYKNERSTNWTNLVH